MAGSNGGVVARIVSHHARGTGGFSQPAGSDPAEWAGITRVPSVPTTASSARITAVDPPQTQPRELREECTSTVIPARSPSRRRSAASDCSVTGLSDAAITSDSDMRYPCNAGLRPR